MAVEEDRSRSWSGCVCSTSPRSENDADGVDTIYVCSNKILFKLFLLFILLSETEYNRVM